jgi:hypothetical protein
MYCMLTSFYFRLFDFNFVIALHFTVAKYGLASNSVFKALEAVLTDTVRRGLEQQHEQVSLENR